MDKMAGLVSVEPEITVSAFPLTGIFFHNRHFNP
jgi:hypothetical protein